MNERKPVLTRAMWMFASLCTGVMVLLFVLTHRLAHRAMCRDMSMGKFNHA